MDPDNTGTLTTTVSVSHGVIWVNPSAGASVSSNVTGSVTLNGTASQINATLGSLSYIGGQDWFGGDGLWVVTNDNGNAGTGGAKSDADVIPIGFSYQYSGGGGNDAFSATYGLNQKFNAGAGTDTIYIPFALTSATITWANSRVTIAGPGGSRYVLNGFETYAFSDGTINNADSDRLIDDLFYYARNQDVWAARGSWGGADAAAESHYNAVGKYEGRNPNPFFSLSHYYSQNPDVVAAGYDLLWHYRNVGWTEGRNPSAGFSVGAYRAQNPDVAAANIDPLYHYLVVGMDEGRTPVATGLPVILDLDGNGVEVTALQLSSAAFDMDGRTGREHTAWAGKGDGILAIDLGGDGVIDQSSEIVFTNWAPGTTSDMAALRLAFDTNRNGALDAGDARWSEFRIWQDADSDGVSRPGEVQTLDQRGIASIDLNPAGPAQQVGDGSVIQGVSTYRRTDGTTGTAGDVALAYDASGGDAFLAMLERNIQLSMPQGFAPDGQAGSGGAAGLIQALAIHSVDRGGFESGLLRNESDRAQPALLAAAWHQ
jgi:hypothetical protein